MAIEKLDISKKISTENLITQKSLTNMNKETITVDVKANPAKLALAKRLGITVEQLDQIANMHPEIYTSKEPEKFIIKLNTLKQDKEISKDISLNDKTLTTKKEENTVAKFDNKAFAAASNTDKAKIYAEELAKNKFMYADSKNRKTADDWQALSKEQKQALIKTEEQGLEANKKIANGKSQEDISKLLQHGMTELQAANYQGVSVKNLDKNGLEYREETLHEYVFNLEPEERTEQQNKYISVQKHKSDLLRDYAKKKGVELSDSIMRPGELNAKCKELGADIIDLEIEELEAKKVKKNGQFTKDDADRLKELNTIKTFNEIEKEYIKKYKSGKFEKSGLLEGFESSDFGKDFASIDSTDEVKCKAVIDYVRTLPKEQRTPEKLANLFHELGEKNPELAMKIRHAVIGSSSYEDQMKFAQSKNGLVQANMSVSINAVDTKVANVTAETQKALNKEDPELAGNLATLRIECSDGEHRLATSKTDASFGNAKVEKAHVDAALDKSKVDAKTQLEMLNDTYELSGLEARKYAGVNNYQSYTENQLPLHEKAIQDKDVNDAMVEAGTYSKYAKENQTPALKAHKQRYEKGDYSDKEAIDGLNKLSDYIADCDKDNQLAMHNEMMNSKYSEVQEHVAGNIKNYDPTVQPDAYNSTSGSGSTVNSGNNFTNPIRSQNIQNLSENTQQVYNDLSTLSSDGKPISRDVAIKMFQKLELNEQREFLKSLSPQQVAQIPISVCNSFPELIETFVDLGKGVEIIQQCNIGTGNKTIQLMAKSKGATKKQFNDWAANHTDRLAKCTYDNLVESGLIKVNKNKAFSFKG